MLPEPNTRKLSTPCRVVDPRRPNRQQLRRSVRGEQRLAERDGRSRDIESELLGHGLIQFGRVTSKSRTTRPTHPSRLAIAEQAFQPHHHRAEIGMKLLGPLQRFEQGVLAEGAVTNPPSAITLD